MTVFFITLNIIPKSKNLILGIEQKEKGIMFTNEEITKIITDKIKEDENIGHSSGGSGHLGFTSFEIKDYSTNIISANSIKIKYTYTIFIETEFTYYPDNPPQEYDKTKEIVLDSNKKIIAEN